MCSNWREETNPDDITRGWFSVGFSAGCEKSCQGIESKAIASSNDEVVWVLK
jgi:hypothetical protein